MTEAASYLRFPTVHGEMIAFVAEDDVWLAAREGGRAWRLTADRAPVAGTRFSPDGSMVAFTSRRDGATDVYVVGVAGGPVRRLTHWGDRETRVVGWSGADQVLAVSPAAQPFRSRTWAYAVPLDGGPAQRLPYGPVTAVAPGPGGVTVLGVHQRRRGAAAWKRYRGGMAGALWIDRNGDGQFRRFLADLAGQLEDPAWVGERLILVSDHEGWGNLYSCNADGADLRRHSDHGRAYARATSTDGQRVIYQCLGELWLLDELSPTSEPRLLDVRLSGPRTARQPRPLPAREHLGAICADYTGRASAVEVWGTVHWLTHQDGPARALADQPGVRARLPRVLGATAGPGETQVAWVTDAAGDDAIEVASATGGEPPRRLAAGQLGRVLELAAASDGSALAVASHDGRVLVVDVASGSVRHLDASSHGDASGLSFAPDSRWLAWSHPGPEPLRQIRMAYLPAPAGSGPAREQAGSERAAVAAYQPIEVTSLRFTDTDPVFTVDGQHLAFLSARTFDPVYDEHVLDMSFPAAIRPYLLPLMAATPSPFGPDPDGRPPAPSEPAADDHGGDPAPAVTVDVEGLDQRIIPVPVPVGRYSTLQAARGGLLWLAAPLVGLLGHDAADANGERRRPRLQRYDLAKRRLLTLAEGVDDVAVTGDGRRAVLRSPGSLRVVPADRPADSEDGGDHHDGSVVEVELDRLRVQVNPAAQWRQMYEETGRLMRDHFWVPDFAGVDWAEAQEHYRPLLDRIGSRDDLSEVLWELQGELGASHAYEMPPDAPVEAIQRLGYLGADLARGPDESWQVVRIMPGESSVPTARSPLLAPGVAIRVGDVIVAVDGRPVDPVTGPGPLLVGAGGVPVELTVRPGARPEPDEPGQPGEPAQPGGPGQPDGSGAASRHDTSTETTPSGGAGQPRPATRRAVVVPLEDERPLRYHAWVTDRRAAVHAASGGRVGYLHIPDMMAEGWAQLHRDLHVEVARDALVVDVRDNGGGHISELVLEKLARRVRGWDNPRHAAPSTYPRNAPRGPLVVITNESAGSDGDIVTAVFRQLGLGPVVGTRTWGGVIGIDGRYQLVDGTTVTQPRYAIWLEGTGWSVENHGVDPDVEVAIQPQDWAVGADPQLDTAVRLALEALHSHPAATPPDLATRPSRTPPALPPRPAARP